MDALYFPYQRACSGSGTRNKEGPRFARFVFLLLKYILHF